MDWTVKGSIKEASLPYLVCQFQGHETAVYGSTWLSNGTILTWSEDWTLRLWNPHTGELLRILSDPGRTMSGFGGIRGALELSDHHILSWGFDGIINVWSQESTEPVHRLVGHTQPVSGALEIEQGTLLSWSGDMTFRVWHLTDPAHHSILPFSASWDDMLASQPPLILQSDGGIICWSYNQLIYLEKDSDQPHQVTLAKEEDILLAIQLQSGNLITFGEEGTLLEWQLPEIECVTKYQSIRAQPMDLCQLRDGRFVTRAAGRLWIWRSGVDLPEVLIDPPNDAIAGVAPLNSGGLIYRTLNRELVSWNEDLSWIAKLPDWREPIRLVPCSESLIVVWSARESWLKAISSDAEYVLTPNSGQLTAIKVSKLLESHHQQILTTTREGGVHCWELSRPSRPIHESVATDIPLSAVRSLSRLDSKRIVACHHAGEVSIHNAETSEYLYTLLVDRSGEWGAAENTLKLTDNRILVWHLPGSLTVWHVDSGKVVGKLTTNDGPVGSTILVSDKLALSWSSMQDNPGFLLWDYSSIFPIKVLNESAVSLGAATIGNGEFITWCEEPQLKHWSITGDLIETVTLHDEPIRGILQIPTGKFLAWTTSDSLSLWSPGQDVVKYYLKQTKTHLTRATLGFRNVLFCTEDRRLFLWDWESQREYPIPYNPVGLVFHIIPISDQQWLIVDQAGTMAITTVNGCEGSYSVPPYTLRSPVVSSDGRWLFVSEGYRLSILSIQDGLTPTASLNLAARVEVLFPLDNNCLALGLSNGTIAICEPQ
jgi:WD40 repeat protein